VQAGQADQHSLSSWPSPDMLSHHFAFADARACLHTQVHLGFDRQAEGRHAHHR